MENMQIYEATRSCPDEALKLIQAGRLKGKSDINPMWRIKTLTEQFGPCGIGWYYDILKQWIEEGANGERSAFCNIALYYKYDGEWSRPVNGTGGAAFIANEKNGAYTSDECYKMALTDAISVACKALGFAADVYWQADRTKYDQPREQAQPNPLKCSNCGCSISGTAKATAQEIADWNFKKFGRVLCAKCGKAEDDKRKAAAQ